MLLRWARVIAALLGFGALVTEVATLVERGQLVPANFFSYFTVEANTFAVVVLLASALARRTTPPLDFFRGASTMFMTVVLLVFSLLLADLEASVLTAVPWDNTVLHYVMPVVVIADWLVDPPSRRVPFRSALWWLLVPSIYVAYSLVRGSLVGWYPYPFLDPRPDGYGPVVLVCLALIAGALVLIWLVTRVHRRR